MTILILKLAETDGKTIRGMILPDGSQVFSVFDFIHKTCAYKDQGACARKQFQRMTSDSSEFKNEINSLCQHHRIPGSRGLETPTMTLRGLQILLCMLGGKVAYEFRKLVEGTFTRVMAGDISLIQVIEGNAASNEPINKAYRAALEKEPVDPVLDEMCKKRKLERKETLLDLEIEERQIRIEDGKLKIEEGRFKIEEGRFKIEEGKQRMKTQALENTETLIGILTSLRPDQPIDMKTIIQIEQQAKRILLSEEEDVEITEEDMEITEEDMEIAEEKQQPISVSMLANAMGYKCNDIQRIGIGKLMVKRYREKYRDEPQKHQQMVNGDMIPVNSYTERDRDMMEATIKEYMEAK